MNNIEWKEHQKAFVEKLQSFDSTCSEILKKDSRNLILDYEMRAELANLQKKGKSVLNKLVNHEFTVALVGLEKAGKSTLGNALLQMIALPDYTERCTYTTTEIRSGTENTGTISFYSLEEFNAKFKKYLKTIRYEKDVNFSDLRLETFEYYWKEIEEKDSALYMTYNGTIVEDIKAMLQGRNEIEQFLGHEPITFTGDDKLNSSEFTIFITGINGHNSDGSVTRSSIPYAVKNVKITSCNLKEMSNIVLFDVPGFDSPTNIHKEQTENMLKEADAIILVTNVGQTPNLNGPQLEMLRKGRDGDEIKLTEKTFVFGNCIDKAGNKKLALDNVAALTRDSVKQGIAEQKRVFYGSAKGYLHKHNLFTQDEQERGKVEVISKLDEMEINDGVDNLKESLAEYYSNDRFDVLKKRAEKIIDNVYNFLKEKTEKYDDAENFDYYSEFGSKYILQSKNALVDFKANAKKIVDAELNTICENSLFSKAIQENIEEIFPTVSIDDDLYKQVKDDETTDTDNVSHLSQINASLRSKLQVIYKKNLIERTSSLTRQEQEKIREKIVECFLNSMGMEPNNQYKEELKNSVNELLENLLIKDGERCQFNPLIERFSNSLIEALITHPFTSQDRLNKLKSALPEYRSLAVYYENYENKDSEIMSDSEFCCWILSHKRLKEVRTQTNEKILETTIDKVLKATQVILPFAVDALPIPVWAKKLIDAGIYLTDKNVGKLQSTFSSEIQSLKTKNINVENTKNVFDTVISAYTRSPNSLTQQLTTLSESLNYFSSISRNLLIENEEKLIDFLNEDIEILRDITLHSVIKAIALERAFKTVIYKNIDLIREATGDIKGSGEKYDEWIGKYTKKVRQSEFATIANDFMDNETRKNIVESIKNLLKNMEV